MTRRFLQMWLLLLALVAVQLAAALLHLGIAAPFVALVMAAILLIGPMRIADAPQLAWVFALGGAFWLIVVLFGLGTLEPLTRHTSPAQIISQP